MYIDSEQQLRNIYGFPKKRFKDRQLSCLEKHSINFIERSPFFLMSTCSQSGSADCSPRGGEPGFVSILSETCLVVPDAKGNNRLDSLVNIIETGSVGCLFLIPGVDETLRINGFARLSNAPEYLGRFHDERNPPKTCIEITIKEVFLHCAKALMRSKLWSPDSRIDRSKLPTLGQMVNDQLSVAEAPESQEDMIKRFEKDL
ncbi:pyridoxamine 5'-phosphate oxidase family protein [Marinobacter sp.]|uniref:pyridoxamine 5'-phosphate oxidase family protein n=1 Tax=Marinobacter sp. TaxID=50741 RepID=UPI002B4A91F7|nr:pyridoxamine 5'-phosphate oxidase family protein [Marinobacter sp.]HKK56336.1 pyridoxamine 5'-phosphate oxidase family protein [Marinobacter sp.]